jgi:hypothetical protein
MSNSLKFTLKQLLDLGIICSHKKKKRRDPVGKSGVITGVNQVAPSQVRYIQGQGQSFPQQVNPYADPFDPNRYTYAVRLREEEDRKLIRKLQEKQQQQAFQSNVMTRLNEMGDNEIISRNYAQPEEDIYGDVGYAREDMNGYFGRTANDDEFKSQQVGGFAEGEDAGYFSAREDFGMAPEEMPQEEGFGSETTAKEGGFDPEQLSSETVRPKTVRRSADFYRNYYEELAGASADPNILKSKKAQPIKDAILKLQKQDYRELGGTERKFLTSKSIDEIKDEIARMMIGKKKSP